MLYITSIQPLSLNGLEDVVYDIVFRDTKTGEEKSVHLTYEEMELIYADVKGMKKLKEGNYRYVREENKDDC